MGKTGSRHVQEDGDRVRTRGLVEYAILFDSFEILGMCLCYCYCTHCMFSVHCPYQSVYQSAHDHLCQDQVVLRIEWLRLVVFTLDYSGIDLLQFDCVWVEIGWTSDLLRIVAVG